jgi:hypothetical protein
MTGAALSVLIRHDGNDISGLATTATSAAALTAYLAMTPGGQGIRVVGEFVWIGSNTIARTCQTLWMEVCDNNNKDNNKNNNANESIASNGVLTTTKAAPTAAPPASLINNVRDIIIMTMTNGRAIFLSKAGKDPATNS